MYKLMTRAAVGLAMGLLMATTAPVANEQLQGPVHGEVLRIVNSNRVEVRARSWLGHSVTTLVRIRGIKAPELRGRCPAEKQAADQAVAMIFKMIPPGTTVLLYNVDAGISPAHVHAGIRTADGRDVAQTLLQETLVRPSGSGGWCDD